MAHSQHDMQIPNQAPLRPTYQNRLRVIGQHLDRDSFRDVAVFEIDGGFIVRATAPDQRRPQALEFPDDQFTKLMEKSLHDRGYGQSYNYHANLLPTGYEDFFRSLGFLLDNQSAVSITIIELNTHVLVTGNQPSKSVTNHKRLQEFERYLTADDMQNLLNDAFQRRVVPAKRGGFRSIF